MGKRKVVEPVIAIENWDSATMIGAELAQLDQRIKSEEAEYNKNEQELRSKLTAEHAPLRSRIADLEKALERFCTINKDEFLGKRSRDLQHIIVGFRTHPPKVKQISGVKMAFTLQLIKSSRWASKFIAIEESLSKESVLVAYKPDAVFEERDSIGDEELGKLGLQIVQDETFSWSPKLAVEEAI